MKRQLLPLLLLCALAGLPASAAAAARLDRAERKVIRHINFARALSGLAPVHASRRLQRAADGHTGDMVRHGFFSHNSSDGTPFATRVRRQVGNAAVGEALAVTRRAREAAAVVQMWLASPPHRAVLLEPGFRRIGIARRSGYLAGTTRAVWTADFSSRG